SPSPAAHRSTPTTGSRPAADRRVRSPLGRKRPPRSRRVHLVDQIGEHLLDGVPLDLLGGGQLTVFVVELLGEQAELPDVLHPGELLVRLVHDFLDELDHLRLLGQVAIRGVRDPVSRRPVADGVELDPDQGGQIVAAVADDHRLLDVRGRLEAVLDLRRGDVLSPGRDDDVLDPVDDLDVGAVDPLADVAGLQPPVLGEHLGGGFRAVPVALEVAAVLGLDFTGLRIDAEADAGIRLAHRADLVASPEVVGGDGRVLGNAVQLVDWYHDADDVPVPLVRMSAVYRSPTC